MNTMLKNHIATK